MDIDHQQQQVHSLSQSPFPSPDARFSPHLQRQQLSPSHSQQLHSQPQPQQQQQQQQQPSPESPSQPLSQPQAQPLQAQGPSQGQNQQWATVTHHQHPHLLPISVSVSAGTMSAVSASPTSYSPASAHPTDSYPFFSQQTPAQVQAQLPNAQDGTHRGHAHTHAQHGMERSGSLSLNIGNLHVQSPATLSPLTPSPHPSTASTTQTLSPVTPLSPSTTPHAHHYNTGHGSRHSGQQGHGHGSMFAYAPPSDGPFNSTSAYDSVGTAAVSLPAYARAPPSSRSSSAASTTAALSTKSCIPRKRSFNNAASLPVSTLEVNEPGAVPGYNPAHELAGGFDDVDVDLYSASGGMDMDGRGGSGGSPGEGAESSSGDGDEDPFKSLTLSVGTGTGSGGLSSLSIPGHGGYGPVSAKTTGTNNFVTKLYQMINDPKSAMFIQWTELGTSFVVSNIGEFSRTILGAHFKHNNFSSFVRQLNMYGFHKINRGRQTPRGARGSASGSQQNSSGSTDQQTWEFSHHKFLRGRPDLLEEIKRKALEPDPGVKARVELPGELAAQLAQMRENHRRVVRALEWERARVDRLVGFVRGMNDVFGRAFPGSVAPFPSDLWETPENNPPIFITSPTAPSPGPGRAYGNMNGATANGMGLPNAFQSLQPFSPGSSPTGSEFGHAGHGGHYAHAMHAHHAGQQHVEQHTAHHLSRAHSMQNLPYDTSFVTSGARYEDPMEFDASGSGSGSGSGVMGLGDRKRLRTGAGFVAGSSMSTSSIEGRRLARARSDSAPLGYGAWGTGAGMGPGSGTSGTGSGSGGSGSAGMNAGMGRPRSGTGIAHLGATGARATAGVGGGRRVDDLMLNISGKGIGPGQGGGQGQLTNPLVPKSGG